MDMENREELEKEPVAEEETPEILPEETEPEPYVPRPAWQRAMAWIALVIFLGIVAMYYVNIMRGGL